MVNITADECLQASLGKLTEVAAIRDADGNMIGILQAVGDCGAGVL